LAKQFKFLNVLAYQFKFLDISHIQELESFLFSNNRETHEDEVSH